MLKKIGETDYYKQSIYVELINKLTIISTESKRKLKSSIYDLGKQDSSLVEDLFKLEEILSKLFLKFIDSYDNFEKTLAENQNTRYVSITKIINRKTYCVCFFFSLVLLLIT